MPRRRERRPSLVQEVGTDWTGHIVLSGILPVMGGRGREYKNCRMMSINTLTKGMYGVGCRRGHSFV